VDGLPVACRVQNQFQQVKKSIAVYTDLKYKISDTFALRGGLRFTHDTGRQTGFSSNAFGVDNVFVANLIPTSALYYSNNNWSGKFGFDYQITSRNMLYGNVSKGYRAPSFNAQAFFDPSELTVAKAEKITAYEIGLKNQFADRRITFNLAGSIQPLRPKNFSTFPSRVFTVARQS
jgi:iron complex outermembrane receptor protein